MSSSLINVTTRPVAAEDIMDVVKWWVNSFKKSKWAGTLPNNKFSEYMGESIRQLISRGSRVTLAVNSSNPSQVLGFICTEKTSRGEPVVHFLFVKDIYRGRGLGLYLLKSQNIPLDGTAFYTHRTDSSKKYRAKHVPEIARRKDA
jgi:hypothetical protein